jgi:hypothetical protein
MLGQECPCQTCSEELAGYLLEIGFAYNVSEGLGLMHTITLLEMLLKKEYSQQTRMWRLLK